MRSLVLTRVVALVVNLHGDLNLLSRNNLNIA